MCIGHAGPLYRMNRDVVSPPSGQHKQYMSTQTVIYNRQGSGGRGQGPGGRGQGPGGRGRGPGGGGGALMDGYTSAIKNCQPIRSSTNNEP